MKIFLNLVLISLSMFPITRAGAEDLFLDGKIKETIDSSIIDLNRELRRFNANREEFDYDQEVSNQKVEMIVDQGVLDNICVDCPKLAKLATQVNSALNSLVSVTSLKNTNLPLELQNLEAMTYVVRDAAKNQSYLCPIIIDAKFSKIISNNELESQLAVLILSKQIDKGVLSSVQIYKPNEEKVYYYRGKKPHQDKIVRVTVGSNQKAKVDYFILASDLERAQKVAEKIAVAREKRKAECAQLGKQNTTSLAKGVEISTEDCSKKLSVQAGLNPISYKDASGADQIGEIKLIDVQARIIEGPISTSVGTVISNRATTARLGLGDKSHELIYSKISDSEGGEISGGIPYEFKTPGKIGATFSGEFSGKKNLVTNTQSEQVTLKVQPHFIGSSLSASAQANQEVLGSTISKSENYSLEVNQPIGAGNLCFRYGFQMKEANLLNPTYWACYRVKF